MIFPHLPMRALELAARWHQGQMRKHPSEQIPYIAHPAGVGMLLMAAGADDETIAAGILHDVIEDCGISKDELAVATTEQVADLVSWVTEQSKSLPWAERKRAYRERLADAPISALKIAAADHIHNLQSLLNAAQTSEDVWAMFHSDRVGKLANERAVYEVIAERLDSPLVGLYQALLEEVDLLP